MTKAVLKQAAQKVAVKPNPQTEQPETEAPVEKKGKGIGYTYIGAGEGSPYVINLMGKQKFVRGELTEVTDPEILQKIDGISTFVKGKADPEILHRIDEEAKNAADAQRQADAVLNAAVTKKHRVAGKGE